MRGAGLAALLLGGWTALAAGQPGTGGPPPSGSEWVEDSAEALADLAEAGLTVAPAVGEPPGVTAEGRGAKPWGFAGIRGGWRADRGLDLTTRLRLDPGPWRVKGRWRSYADGTRESAFALGFENPALSVFVGHLGYQHGYGLLSAAPGRTPSLSADQGLGMARTRVRDWTGTADGRTHAGAAAVLRRGAWSLLGLVGGNDSPGSAAAPRTAALRISFAGPGGGVGLGVMSRDSVPGAGVTGRILRRTLRGETEFIVWRPEGDPVPRWAGVAAVRWTPVRTAFLETAWAAADAPGGWEAGHRPALLPGWAGRGYALRGGLRTPDGLKLQALTHQGWVDAEDPGGDRNRRRLLDLRAERRISPAWGAHARLRRVSWTRWERHPRHPWWPAEPATTRLQTVISLTLVHERAGWRSAVLLRSLGQETPGDTGRRSLVSFTVRGSPGPDWVVRGFAAAAWGDDVDLVTAVVPLSGLVLSRHWGRWRSETGAGIGWSFRGLALQAAAGFRRAEPGRGETDRFWGQVSVEGRW